MASRLDQVRTRLYCSRSWSASIRCRTTEHSASRPSPAAYSGSAWCELCGDDVIRTSRLRLTLTVAAFTLAVTLCGASGASAAAPRWVRLSPVTVPPASVAQPMAYDAATNQLVFFDQAHGQTWTWDGVTWKPQPTLTNPSPRNGAAMDYDAATRQLIL